nr:hypothetical protein [uncultured Oscillibacter sp.]
MPFETKFRPLTPNDAIDLHHYQEALDYVFSSGKIRNIALTGSYGSGKSSVIRSYENHHKDDRTFIHISLARFEEQGQSAENSVDPTKTVNILEGKIINQLLHQIPEKELSPSYIQPQGKISWKCHLLMVLSFLAFIVSGIYVFQFQKWVSAVSGLGKSQVKSLLQITTNPYGRLIGIGLLLILLGCGMFYILRTYPLRVFFKRVDLKGLVGIELFSAEEDTYFDKYLHRVLQLFDQANADAIIFEDLDRYDVTLIFEKLREISDLAFSREKLGLRKDKKPLRFFYLIRDDVFTASDRSKFFDFIIPVVPYVDASNSCDQLLQRFEEAGFDGLFTKRFLQDVSLYLGDMRLVSNIVNEYSVYHGRLSGSGLATKPDRQLAMVIYKNLYPGDFDLLQKGRGYVYALFEQKKEQIRKEKALLDVKIYELRLRLKEGERETLTSMDNLNALYFPLPQSEITVDGTNVSTLSRAEQVRQILEKSNAVKYASYTKEAYSSRYIKTMTDLDVKSKQAEMEANEEYIRHKRSIEAQGAQLQKEIMEEIQGLRKSQTDMDSKNLRELLLHLEEDEEDDFWSPELPPYEPENYQAKIQKNKNFSLLKYLLRNGYIDENYAAYVSYFYPNSLTAQDRNFLLSITDRAPLEYAYRLNRPGAVLERLEEADFFRREARNFDLLSHLLRTRDPHLHTFLQSGTTDQSAHTFFAEFWRTGRQSTRAFRFIRALCQEHPEWFRTWCESTSILWEGEWRLFILDALYFFPLAHLSRINEKSWLTERISADSKFLQMDSPNVRRLIPALKALNVQFSRIDYREADISLVREICKENLYVLNLSMLKTAMAVFWNVPATEDESRNYTHILRHPGEPLSLRVLGNMDVYASAILHESGSRFSDSEEAVIDFLNCESLSELYKEEYIQRSDTVLPDINAIASHTLWTALIGSQSVAYSWQNMADYFAEFAKDTDTLPPELVTFINNGNGVLGWKYKQLNQRIGDRASKLWHAVLVDEGLSLERYRAALAGMTISYRKNPFPLHEISEDRMKIVLDLGIVPVTVKNTEVIREYYPQLWNDFVLAEGAYDLTKLMDTNEVQLTESELASLLEDSRMKDSIAENMLFIFSKTVSLQNRKFSTPIRVRIIEAHLDPDDLPFLLKSFALEPPAVRSAFLDYAGIHADSIADAAEQTQIIPVEVYAACLNELTEDQLLILRPYLVDKNFEIICTENKKPKFPNTPEVRKILAAFEAYRWISSWKSKDGKLIAFPTRK